MVRQVLLAEGYRGQVQLDDGKLVRVRPGGLCVPQEPTFLQGRRYSRLLPRGWRDVRQLLLDYHQCSVQLWHGRCRTLKR